MLWAGQWLELKVVTVVLHNSSAEQKGHDGMDMQVDKAKHEPCNVYDLG